MSSAQSPDDVADRHDGADSLRSRGSRWWLSRDFGLLWLAQTLSVTGSEFSKLGFPLVGLLLLDASAPQVALLWAMQTIPYLLFSLPLGVLVDRVNRRRIMIVTDVVRAGLLVALVLLAVTQSLTLGLLLATAFLIGLCTVAFELAYVSVIPAVVESTQQVLKANVRLNVSDGLAFSLGPAVAGYVIRWWGPAASLAVDAVSYLASGLLVTRVREAPRETAQDRERFSHELRSGLVFVARHSLIRPIVMSTALSNVSFAMFASMLVVFATRMLSMPAHQIGIVFSVAALSFLLGSAIVEPVSNRLGIGPTMVWSLWLNAISILVCFAQPGLLGAVLVGVSWSAISLLVPMYNVTQLSLRQLVTPQPMMGRMHAAVRVVAHGSEPLGAILGGGLAVWIGLRATLAVSVGIAVLAALPLMLSPVMKIRSLADIDRPGIERSPDDG